MKPGYHVMTADEYHADPCVEPSLSNSIAQILLRESPRKAAFSHPRLNPAYKPEEEGKFDIGTAVHAMLLEGVDKMFVCNFDDWRKKEAREQRDEARAMGQLPILAHQADGIHAMRTAALAFIAESEIAEYWSQAESEITAIWQEDETWLRCRFDRITKNHRCAIDYKSTTDASPEAFSRQLVRMGYHWQDAFYRRAVRALDGKDPAFVFLAQSIEPPYECSLHGCDPALREIADADIERAIEQWRYCIDAKYWPSYDGRIHWTIPTTWQMKEHETRLMEAA